nr:unnamed protein product [Callosobruchus analis]
MISNNTSYKLRATKSSRDVHEYEYANEENWDEDGGEGSKKGSFLRDSRGSKNVGRSRSTEFRPSRVSDRRGYRGRGSTSRRSDRDYSEGYYSRKYESRHIEALVNQRGSKFYEPEKKTEVKLNLPEDTRISKLLRRLNNETDQDASLAVSKKLLEVLLLPDNAHYVRKAFHILGESMYQHWLFTKMNESYEDIPVLLMKSFNETLSMEAKKPVLEHHVDNLINNLVATIETTENAEVFKAILDVLVAVVEMYPSEFQVLMLDIASSRM